MNLAVPPVTPPAQVARGHHFLMGVLLVGSSTSAARPRPRRALLALCAAGCALGAPARAALPFSPSRLASRVRVYSPASRSASASRSGRTARISPALVAPLVSQSAPTLAPALSAPALASGSNRTLQPVATLPRTPKTSIVSSPQEVGSRLGRIAQPSIAQPGTSLKTEDVLIAALPELSPRLSGVQTQSNAQRVRLSRSAKVALAFKNAPAFPHARYPAFAKATLPGAGALPDLAPANLAPAPVPVASVATGSPSIAARFARVPVVSNAGGGTFIQFKSSATIATSGGAASNVSSLPLATDNSQVSVGGMKKVIQVPGLSLPPLSQPLPDWMQAASVRVDRIEKGGKNAKRIAQNPGGAPVRQPAAPVTNSDRLSNQIEVAVSTFVVLLTTTDLQTVAVADPSIADVAVVNSRSVLLNGKGPGVTSLVIVDGQKIRQYVVRVTSAPGKRPLDITAAIGIPGVSVRSLGDALVLEGEVASPAEAQHAVDIAGVYSAKVLNQLSVRPAGGLGTADTSIAQLSDLLSDYPGVKARIAGDTIILTGEVSDPNQIGDAQTVAGTTGKKVVNLIRLPALTVDQLRQSLGGVDLAQSLSSPGQMTAGAPISVRELGGQLIIEGFVPAQGDIDLAVASARRTGLPVVNRLQVRPALTADQVLVSSVAAAIGRPGITVRGTTKRLVLEGIVGDTNEAVAAEQVARAFVIPVLGQVDNLLQTRSPVQVNVDVTIAEINSNDARALGVQYGTASLTSENVSFTNVAGAGGTPVVGPNGIPLQQKNIARTIDPAFKQGVALAGNGFLGLGPKGFIDPFRVRINALQSNGRARILSAPSTTVLSGRTATFQVGGQVPIPSISSVGVGGSTSGIVFKDYGILLDVVPNALPNGVVTLRIRTEVSQPDFANGVTPPGGGSPIPGFQRRSTVTEVTVPPNGVLSLSGLIRSEDTRTETGVPILSKIPIIGALFKSKDFRTNKTELVIFVRPRVLPNPLTGDQLAPAAVVAVGENTNVATQLGNPGLTGFNAGGAISSGAIGGEGAR